MNSIKIILVNIFMLLLLLPVEAQYAGFKINPDGTFVLGGRYPGFKVNPDGTYVVGRVK